MAWQVPMTHEEWEGFSWGEITPAFINQFLTAAAMRASAASQAAAAPGGAVTAELLLVGANLQGTGQINRFRPQDVIISGDHVLKLAGDYGRNLAGTTAAGLYGSARWVSHSGLLVGSDWLESTNTLWSVSAGFTPHFLSLVNEKLEDWGLDPMGTSLIDHGGGQSDIPWTRKYGDKAAPSVAFGQVAVGDIIGEWIFNEWRAVLDVLGAIAKTPSWSTPDSWLVWEGGTNGGADCDDAKSAVSSSWENARTRPVSPVTDPPAQVSATGTITFELGEGWPAWMTRTWLEYEIQNCDAVEDGVWNIYIFARKWGDTFEDFDDFAWEEDKIGQIEEATGAPFTFSPSPFKDPSTDSEEIQRVPCPTEGEVSDTTAIGYVLDDAPRMVVVLSFPDP